MLEKNTAAQVLGLSIENDILYCATLALQEGTPLIEDLFTLPLESTEVSEEEADVKPLYMRLEESEQIPDTTLVISGIDTSSTLTRTLNLPLTKPSEIQDVLEFQAEPLIPYPIDEAILDSIQTDVTKEGSTLICISVRSDHIGNHLDHYQELGFEPEIVSCTPVALASFSYYYSQSPKTSDPVFVIHVGFDQTTRVLGSEGKLISSHRIPIGLDHLVAAVAIDLDISYNEGLDALKKLDLSSLDSSTPELQRTIQTLRLEINKSLYALAKQEKVHEVEEILLVGDVFPSLRKALSKDLPTELSFPQTSQEIISTSDLQKYAIAIGLALTGLPTTLVQINFRQKEFAYPHPWKRFKIPLAIYFSSCLLLAFSFWFLGNTWISSKQYKIQEKFIKTLTSLEIPYSSFERDFSGKTIDTIQKINTSELSTKDLQNRVFFLQKKISSNPKYYPLHPNIPRVSDVLAWLSTHPQVVGTSEESPINIENFSYSISKRPKKGKEKDPYQVKVKLEFTSTHPKQARQFRDALMSPNEFIDPKAEVKWSSTRDHYNVSFFLNDKTYYPYKK